MKIDTIRNDFKQLSTEELESKIAALKQELFSLRVDVATTHVKDYSQFKKIRKNIARLLTYRRHKDV